MERTAIERQKLSDRLAAVLEDEIVSGERPVGDRLPSEREMMRLYGVGRPTIREALFNLQKKGLVEVSNGARTRITRPTPAIILDDISGAEKYLLAQPSGQQNSQNSAPSLRPVWPWTVTLGDQPLALALKSGNFGAPDFFVKAFDSLS